jgi:hypothetical protein
MEPGGLFDHINRWIRVIWRGTTSLIERIGESLGLRADVEPHTQITFRAIVDAVIPETPNLETTLGPDHSPGGLAIGLDDFMIWYINNGFQLGFPYIGPQGNVSLADPVAQVLDAAALTILDRNENTTPPSNDYAFDLLDTNDSLYENNIGPFARLSRTDRLRAIGILDEFEIEISPVDGELFEFDAGLIGQLVVGFTEMIYYSEWARYDEFDRPPSTRVYSNTPRDIQSWRQTDYPGVANGYAALRGYLGTETGPLGNGDTWTAFDDVAIMLDSGSFRENTYDTTHYTEPYAE